MVAFSHASQLQSFISGSGPMLNLSLREDEGRNLRADTCAIMRDIAQRLAQVCQALRLITLYDFYGDVHGQGISCNGRLEHFSCVGPFVNSLNGESLRFWLPVDDMLVAAPGWEVACSSTICSVMPHQTM